MKKNDFVKLAVAAGLCFSGQSAREELREMVTTKSEVVEEQAEEPQEEVVVQEKRDDRFLAKSAAKRVVEGIERPVTLKSAAKRAMEDEAQR